jgi:hypothetical protein
MVAPMVRSLAAKHGIAPGTLAQWTTWPNVKIHALLEQLPLSDLRDIYERSRIQDCSCGAKVLPCRCLERRLFDFLSDEKWHGWDEIDEALGEANRKPISGYRRDWRRQFELLTVQSRHHQGHVQIRVKKSRGKFYCSCGPQFERCQHWCPFLKDPELVLPIWVEAYLQRRLFTETPGFQGMGKAFRDGYRDPPRPREPLTHELETRAKAVAMADRCHRNLGLWHPLDFLQIRMPDADTLLMAGTDGPGIVSRQVHNNRNGSSDPGRHEIRSAS